MRFLILSFFNADPAFMLGVTKSDGGRTGVPSRLVVDKVLGVIAVLAIVLPSLLFTNSHILRHMFFPAVASLVVVLPIAMVVTRPRARADFSRVQSSLVLKGGGVRLLIASALGAVRSMDSEFSPRVLLINLILALCFRLNIAVILELAADVCAISLTLQDLIVLSVATQLSFFVPIGIGGIGVKELTQVAVVMMVGISKQNAVEIISLGYPMLLTLVFVGVVLINLRNTPDRQDLQEA